MKQYQIVLVKLDPSVGHEITKTRPCLILSPDELNDVLPTVVVAPLTSSIRHYQCRTVVYDNGQKSEVCFDQIRAVDKSRIIEEFDMISKKEIANTKAVLQEFFID